jgi:hypothetical protein
MIIFLVAAGHRYTHQRLLAETGGPAVSLVYYHEFFDSRQVPPATYIFTDFDRLNYWQLEVAAEAFRVIKSSGSFALNDPARVRQRYALLRQLQREGINRFGVYRIEAGEMPERYPVFLRNECSHGRPISPLIADSYSLKAAIDEVLTKGEVPERHLIAVEYAAEPISEGLFRKLAAFRIGDRIVPTASVHEKSWIVKYGERGVAGEDLYQEENELIRTNPYEKELTRAFATANIEYGRADFAIVDGSVQIYEINTNPSLPREDFSHPSISRRDSKVYSWTQYVSALRAIDRTGESAISLDGPKLRRWRTFFGSP